MSPAQEGGVLLLSMRPDCHAPLVEALRGRGLTVSVAQGGAETLDRLRAHPAVVLVDLIQGPGLDAPVIEALNRSHDRSTVLCLHQGDLGKFAEELDTLAVNGFCHVRDWPSIADLAAEGLGVSERGSRG